jgi:phosphotransferase system  glucose/maltose/N-acetylglucosamine-specific IIC component
MPARIEPTVANMRIAAAMTAWPIVFICLLVWSDGARNVREFVGGVLRLAGGLAASLLVGGAALVLVAIGFVHWCSRPSG